MSASTATQPAQPSASGIDVSALSRRELQYLARELELCRGNAKSDVIVEHVVAFMASADGATRVATLMNNMADDSKPRTPAKTPARRTREAPGVTVSPRAMDFAEDATPMNGSADKTEASDASAAEPLATVALSESASSGCKTNVAGVDREGTERENERPAATRAPEPLPKDGTSAGSSEAKRKTPEKIKVAPAKAHEKPAKEDVVPAPRKETPTKKQKSPAKSIAVAEKVAASELNASKKSPAKSAIISDSTKTPPRRQTPVKNGRSPLANVGNLEAELPSKPAVSTLEALLASADDLVAVGSDRVKCTTTGHEMKADVDVISAYIAGKRYQRAHRQKASFARFAPMFVDHPDEKNAHLVWCSVTQTSIARSVERIEAHMKGARYQKELPVWQAEQAAKEAAQKEQDAQPTTKAKFLHVKNRGRKRSARGAIADHRSTKVARSEAK